MFMLANISAIETTSLKDLQNKGSFLYFRLVDNYILETKGSKAIAYSSLDTRKRLLLISKRDVGVPVASRRCDRGKP